MKKKHPLRLLAIGFLGLLVVLVMGIQFVPVERTNPPVTEEVTAPPEVMSILRRSCYDCHSNKTDWPWYAYVAPISWRVTGHVTMGRANVNFTEWDAYDEDERLDIIGEAYEEAEEGHMPLPDYLRVHTGAALSDDDLRVLGNWAGDLDDD